MQQTRAGTTTTATTTTAITTGRVGHDGLGSLVFVRQVPNPESGNDSQLQHHLPRSESRG